MTEEVDHVVARCAVEAHVSKKDDDVAGDQVFNAHAAKEADGVVRGGVGCDIDVAEELNRILVGAGRRGGSRQDGGEEAKVRGIGPNLLLQQYAQAGQENSGAKHRLKVGPLNL